MTHAQAAEAAGKVMLKFSWRDDAPEEAVESVAHLNALLDEAEAAARATRPLVATLAAEDGSSMSIGLGHELAVVSATGPDGMPPYHAADDGSGDESPVVFYVHGHWSEFPRWSCLRPELARDAMRHFAETRELLPSVAWREV